MGINREIIRETRGRNISPWSWKISLTSSSFIITIVVILRVFHKYLRLFTCGSYAGSCFLVPFEVRLSQVTYNGQWNVNRSGGRRTSAETYRLCTVLPRLSSPTRGSLWENKPLGERQYRFQKHEQRVHRGNTPLRTAPLRFGGRLSQEPFSLTIMSRRAHLTACPL